MPGESDLVSYSPSPADVVASSAEESDFAPQDHDIDLSGEIEALDINEGQHEATAGASPRKVIDVGDLDGAPDDEMDLQSGAASLFEMGVSDLSKDDAES